MLKIVFVIALLAEASFGSALPRLDGARNGRIRNGIVSSIEKHPWQASIGILWNFYFCGGSIISRNWVLTAGHCILDRNYTSKGATHVFVGVDSKKTRAIPYPIDYTKVHQEFTFIRNISANDIALVHVSKPFEFNDNIQKIRLYRGPPEYIHGRPIAATGFGEKNHRVISVHLRAVEFDTSDQATCNKLVSIDFHEPVHQQNIICAKYTGNKGLCPGDSGSAATIKVGSQTYLVGVASYGSIPCGSSWSFFVDVSYYYDWIENEMRYYSTASSFQLVYQDEMYKNNSRYNVSDIITSEKEYPI